jgi:hypothetical protein
MKDSKNKTTFYPFLSNASAPEFLLYILMSMEKPCTDLVISAERGGSRRSGYSGSKWSGAYLAAIKGRRTNTLTNFEQAAKTFRKYLGNVLLTELRTNMIQQAVTKMSEQPLAEITIFNHFQRFNTIMRHAVDAGTS